MASERLENDCSVFFGTVFAILNDEIEIIFKNDNTMDKKKIIVIPDIHGRTFWKEAVKNIDDFKRVIFLGDYLDPYPFENITVEVSISNFKEIIDFKKKHGEKVVLLLGNHDMPYFSNDYYKMNDYHCRHSRFFHNDIANLFDENRDMFKIAYVEDDILFTHAGCTSGWIQDVFTDLYEITTLDDLAFSLNNLLNTKEGLKYLSMVSMLRYGPDLYGSCIWSDVREMMTEHTDEKLKYLIKHIKQVFGHTLLAFEDDEGNIKYGEPIENGNMKMIDTHKAFELDPETFTLVEIGKKEV